MNPLKRAALGASAALFALGQVPAIAAEEVPAPESVQAAPAEAAASDAAELFVTFNQGTAASWLTRVVLQENRSNFVFRDFLAGLYLGAELRGLKLFTPRARITAYYPLSSTFNMMPQKPKNPLHYAVDFHAGISFEIDIKEWLSIYAGPAVHMLFLNSDRWNVLTLGAAAAAGIEVPVTRRLSLLLNGVASLDYGNMGSNRAIEPYDYTWQYQVELGIRFSKDNGSDALFGGTAAENTAAAPAGTIPSAPAESPAEAADDL